jgi:WD40 repeat protein
MRDPTGRANHAIYGVALSPDKKLALACSRQGTVWLWDVDTGEERWRHTVPVVRTMGATCVAFSPDGRYALVGGGDGLARQWQLFPWKEVQRLKHSEKHACWSVSYSADGREALTAGGPDTGETGGGICMWDLQTGAEVRRFKGYEQGTWCAVFSPDSRYVLSGGNDATLRLWDSGTAKELRRFSGHTGEVKCVAFSPDGRKALSASTDRTIRLWNVETGQELHRFFDRESHGEINNVAFVPPGRQALWGNFQGMVRLWQLPP